MEHLKVKGWDFYNSIGKKVVEPEKDLSNIENAELIPCNIRQLKVFDVFKWFHRPNYYVVINVRENDVVYQEFNKLDAEIMIETEHKHIYRLEKPQSHPFVISDFIKSLEDYKCK